MHVISLLYRKFLSNNSGPELIPFKFLNCKESICQTFLNQNLFLLWFLSCNGLIHHQTLSRQVDMIVVCITPSMCNDPALPFNAPEQMGWTLLNFHRINIMRT